MRHKVATIKTYPLWPILSESMPPNGASNAIVIDGTAYLLEVKAYNCLSCLDHSERKPCSHQSVKIRVVRLQSCVHEYHKYAEEPESSS